MTYRNFSIILTVPYKYKYDDILFIKEKNEEMNT